MIKKVLKFVFLLSIAGCFMGGTRDDGIVVLSSKSGSETSNNRRSRSYSYRSRSAPRGSSSKRTTEVYISPAIPQAPSSNSPTPAVPQGPGTPCPPDEDEPSSRKRLVSVQFEDVNPFVPDPTDSQQTQADKQDNHPHVFLFSSGPYCSNETPQRLIPYIVGLSRPRQDIILSLSDSSLLYRRNMGALYVNDNKFKHDDTYTYFLYRDDWRYTLGTPIKYTESCSEDQAPPSGTDFSSRQTLTPDGLTLETDVRNANFSGVTLTGDWGNADFSGAHFHGANLSGADLNGAVFTGAEYDTRTSFPSGFSLEGKGLLLVYPQRSTGRKMVFWTGFLQNLLLGDRFDEWDDTTFDLYIARRKSGVNCQFLTINSDDEAEWSE